MGSYQAAASKLQELAAVSEASQRALIARAEALAKGVEAVVRQAGEATAAAGGTGGGGGGAGGAAADAQLASTPKGGGVRGDSVAGGVGGGGGVAAGEALAVMVAASQSVAGQLAGLQQLMGREVQKQQEMYLEAMQVRKAELGGFGWMRLSGKATQIQ
jgi:hypothetical protein